MQRGSQGIDQTMFQRRRLATAQGSRHVEQQIGRILLAGFPANERIGVVRGKESQLRPAGTPANFTGAEKPRSSDGTGGPGTSSNVKLCSASVQQQRARRKFAAVAIQQPHDNRNDQWLLVRLARCRSSVRWRNVSV